MSDTRKAAELTALKELRSELQKEEQFRKDISQYEHWSKEEPSKDSHRTYGKQLPTDHYAKERQKFIAENEKNKSRITRPFWIIAIALFAILAVCWLIFSGVFQKDTYLHTPEVVGEYSGTYYNYNGECRATLTITSCEENGKLEGHFEFYDADLWGRETYGKYKIKGNILTKSESGYVTAKIAYVSWEERPSGYDPMKDMQLLIYDNYQAIRSETYDLCLYAKDRNEPTSVEELYTPEIIKTYTGEFTPNTGKVGTGSLIIESCSEAGQVTGLLEYSYESQGAGQWKVSGQITQKRTDGSVKLTLNLGDAVYNSYMFYYPSGSFEVEIFDQYRSVYSREGMRWFYADEGFAENPDPDITPVQALAQKAKPILFIGYPIAVLVLAVLLGLKRADSFTPEQQKKLTELAQLDRQNEETNRRNNEQGRAKEAQQRQKDVAYWQRRARSAREELENCSRRIRQASILSDRDKEMSNVNFLLQQMESGRADTLKEALNQMDEQHRRDSERWLRYENERLAAQQRAKFEADQAWHNLNMEYEARRKNDELEKIRKALED